MVTPAASNNNKGRKKDGQRQKRGHTAIVCPICKKDGLANSYIRKGKGKDWIQLYVYHSEIKSSNGYGVKHHAKTLEHKEVLRRALGISSDKNSGIRIQWIPTKAIGLRNTAQLCPKCKSLGTACEDRTDVSKGGFYRTFFSHYLGHIHYIDNATGKIVADIVKRRYCNVGRTKSLDALMDEAQQEQDNIQAVVVNRGNKTE